ncbi:hypothetical protein [Tropicibacter naphthalenivorans]|uniref:hypothetical protein n=1 Tax=Tropicibacter naphthalenivorans TaxID=441103 RepID=UPI0011806B83|nr:hypothetical protein [Tropicibacter naphthalenivorans]
MKINRRKTGAATAPGMEQSLSVGASISAKPARQSRWNPAAVTTECRVSNSILEAEFKAIEGSLRPDLKLLLEDL